MHEPAVITFRPADRFRGVTVMTSAFALLVVFGAAAVIVPMVGAERSLRDVLFGTVVAGAAAGFAGVTATLFSRRTADATQLDRGVGAMGRRRIPWSDVDHLEPRSSDADAVVVVLTDGRRRNAMFPTAYAADLARVSGLPLREHPSLEGVGQGRLVAVRAKWMLIVGVAMLAIGGGILLTGSSASGGLIGAGLATTALGLWRRRRGRAMERDEAR